MREHCKCIMAPKADGFASRQQAADPVLGIDAKGECERIADPCARNSRRDIHACDVSHQCRRQHLDREREEGKKCPHGHARSKSLPSGMPELWSKKTFAQAPVEPGSTDVLGPRHMSQVFAEFCSAPVDRFHCSENTARSSWGLPAKIACDSFRAT